VEITGNANEQTTTDDIPSEANSSVLVAVELRRQLSGIGVFRVNTQHMVVIGNRMIAVWNAPKILHFGVVIKVAALKIVCSSSCASVSHLLIFDDVRVRSVVRSVGTHVA